MLAVDTETTGLDIRDGRDYLVGISIAAKIDGDIYSGYFPFRHATGGNLPGNALEAVRDLLESDTPKVFHNAKFDLVSLSTIDINVTSEFYCTMLMAHLVNENRPFSYRLNSCAAYYLKGELGNQKEMSEEFSKFISVFGWAAVPADMMRTYATQDAVLTLRLASALWPLFSAEYLSKYWDHKQEFIRVIIAMEKAGVKIDTTLCEEQVLIGEARMEEIKTELGGFSPASPVDLRALLIDRLGLPIVKKSEKTGKPSFDKEAMVQYEEILSTMDDKTAQLILEYRGWQKTVSSNYRAYLELLSPDGNLRCNYKLHGTHTGRMSCEKPNLQQIPRVTEKAWNGKLKQAFIAREGYTLWEPDYSQLEFRLGTAYANVQALKDVFLEGRDVFTEMSTSLKLSRQDTKTWVYLTQYGGGVRIAMRKLGIGETQARRIREDYFQTYPGFRSIADRAQGMVLNHGKVKLWSGRYRHFINPDKDAFKAFNSIIQGGAADIVEKVMVRLYNEVVLVSDDEVRMLLQVHDSVVFEIKNGTEEKWKPIIRNIMEDIDTLTAPDSFDVVFKVDFKAWGSK